MTDYEAQRIFWNLSNRITTLQNNFCCSSDNMCNNINTCLGISTEGASDLFLNQQGQFISTGGAGSENLQQVTDLGNFTTNNINLSNPVASAIGNITMGYQTVYSPDDGVIYQVVNGNNSQKIGPNFTAFYNNGGGQLKLDVSNISGVTVFQVPTNGGLTVLSVGGVSPDTITGNVSLNQNIFDWSTIPEYSDNATAVIAIGTGKLYKTTTLTESIIKVSH